MRQCLGCAGLIPEGIERCPNCEVSPVSLGLRTLVVAGSIAATSLASCGVPIYGAPCVSKQVDGGNRGCPSFCDTLLADGGDPTRDPGNRCFTTDGGTP